MTDLKAIVAARLEQATEGKRRQEVREKASEYLKMWGLDGTLPKGVPGDSGECVFAHALGGCWNGSCWELGEPRARILAGCWQGNPNEGYVLNLPPDVQEFINRFDGGEYPDLIEEGAEPAWD